MTLKAWQGMDILIARTATQVASVKESAKSQSSVEIWMLLKDESPGPRFSFKAQTSA